MLHLTDKMPEPIKAVIFDWAGTMVDFGSFAPMGAFIEAFAAFGVETSVEQARGPMGMPKWHHIKAMIETPGISEAWTKAHGAAPTAADVDRVYDVFLPMNEQVAAKYATLVPGATDMLDFLNKHDIKIGSTTGYTRSIMANVLPVARDQGFEPANLVCSDDLIEGRPGPLGIYKCMVDLGVYPPQSIIKVDDTAPGIAEGVSAGCISVGVALSGNYVGKTPEQLAKLSPEQIEPLREQATEKLANAGADHVIDTIADLPDLLEQLYAFA